MEWERRSPVFSTILTTFILISRQHLYNTVLEMLHLWSFSDQKLIENF